MHRKDFLRVLPMALGADTFEVSDEGVTLQSNGKTVRIALDERPPRQLGPTVKVPVLRVEISFAGYSESERTAFMTRFERYFLRAGG